MDTGDRAVAFNALSCGLSYFKSQQMLIAHGEGVLFSCEATDKMRVRPCSVEGSFSWLAGATVC